KPLTVGMLLESAKLGVGYIVEE
ncbi:cytoplasmic protein, partial [Salmonella enterica]|nr:cytoplasmic protein [Salmonella enterica]